MSKQEDIKSAKVVNDNVLCPYCKEKHLLSIKVKAHFIKCNRCHRLFEVVWEIEE